MSRVIISTMCHTNNEYVYARDHPSTTGRPMRVGSPGEDGVWKKRNPVLLFTSGGAGYALSRGVLRSAALDSLWNDCSVVVASLA